MTKTPEMVREVRRIRSCFGLTRGELARSLEVSFNTVSRWEQGTPPTGLHRAVLLALDEVARGVVADGAHAAVVGALVRSGIRRLVEYTLTRHRGQELLRDVSLLP